VPTGPSLIDAQLTNKIELGPTARPVLANIGRINRGCGVGIDALALPICAKAMKPLLSTIWGRAPNKAGFHSTRSATLPLATEPRRCDMPCAMAALIVYFAM
jgi:hypothetical protein